MPHRVAIVTGAAGGVGGEVATLLAAAGYDLALVGRTASTLEATRDRIAAASGEVKVVVIPADLTDPDAAAAVVERTVIELGRLDALANIAGVVKSVPIARTDYATWRTVIDGNLTSLVMLTAAAMPHLKKSGEGATVVNVSSMASIDPYPGLAMYAAAKAGVNLFTLATGREMAAFGGRAMCIAPGAIETPMLRGIFNEKAVPPDAAMDPAEVAQAIVDCLTGERGFDNGETIPMKR